MPTEQEMRLHRCCFSGHRPAKLNKSEEEIKAFTRDTILTFGKRGLMLGADCTVNEHIDHNRLRWVVEAARSV